MNDVDAFQTLRLAAAFQYSFLSLTFNDYGRKTIVRGKVTGILSARIRDSPRISFSRISCHGHFPTFFKMSNGIRFSVPTTNSNHFVSGSSKSVYIIKAYKYHHGRK